MNVSRSYVHTVFFLMMMLYQLTGSAALRDVVPNAAVFGWVKPGTEIIYKKNACHGEVYESGYAHRGPYFEVEKNAYDYYYKGGQCTLTKTHSTTPPATFPKSYNFADYLKLFPGEDHLSTHYHYDCTIDKNTKYSFEFEIEPTYLCTGGGCYEEYSNCVGDVVARYLDIPGAAMLGHTGLYAGTKVLEIADKEAEIIQMHELSDFIGATAYWGSAYNAANKSIDMDPELDYQEAVSLIAVGLSQRLFYPEYTLLPIYKEGHFYVENERIYYEKGLFRCDTFVKYLHKKALGVDLPPFTVYDVPLSQWASLPYKRNPPGNTSTGPSVEGLSSKSAAVLSILEDQSLAPVNKSTRLIANYNASKDRETSLMTYDVMRVVNSQENFKFLLEEYRKVNDVQAKLKILSALRYHYIYYRDVKPDKTTQREMNELKTIYESIIHHNRNPELVRRAIEDVTTLFEPSDSAQLLRSVNPRVTGYRSPYLTSMIMAYINNHQDEALSALVRTMNGCELEDRQMLFDTARDHKLITHEQFALIQKTTQKTPHAAECLHQYVHKLGNNK